MISTSLDTLSSLSDVKFSTLTAWTSQSKACEVKVTVLEVILLICTGTAPFYLCWYDISTWDISKSLVIFDLDVVCNNAQTGWYGSSLCRYPLTSISVFGGMVTLDD